MTHLATNRTPPFLECIERNNNPKAEITNNNEKRSPNSARIEHKKEIGTAMAGEC